MQTFEAFSTAYFQRFADAVLSFDQGPLAEVLAVFDGVIARGGTLWLAGNGGYAAIANHSVCDITKGAHVEVMPPFRSVSLAANVPLMTALGNDVSYDNVFSDQLKHYLRAEDALLVVSSSGNSPNVVKACEVAKDKGVPTIAFVGFKGGKLKQIADTVVHVEVDNYGIVEDIHQSLIHVLTQFMHARSTAASG
jgi:phosphoheptose isomerase